MREKRPVHILGLGLDFQNVPPQVEALIQEAEVLAGGKRILARFGEQKDKAKIELVSPIDQAVYKIAQAYQQDKQVVILADGDPLFFGLGRLLIQKLGPDKVVVHPNITTLQTAAARFKIPWSDIPVVSLHGRKDIFPLLRYLSQGRTTGVFTDQHFSPDAVAKILLDFDPKRFRLHVFEDLATEYERIRSFDLLSATRSSFSDLNFLLVECKGPCELDCSLGLSDQAYVHQKGLITKKEIRLIGLGELNIRPGDTIWDVGAGCGSMSIEASLLAREGRVLAIEQRSSQVACLKGNRRLTGRYFLEVIEDKAPDCFSKLPDPDRIFIGGGLKKDLSVLEQGLDRLRIGGRIVIHLVLMGSLTRTIEFCRNRNLPFSVREVQVARSREFLEDIRLSPLNPVFIVTITPEDKGKCSP